VLQTGQTLSKYDIKDGGKWNDHLNRSVVVLTVTINLIRYNIDTITFKDLGKLMMIDQFL
jgi:hypothetical protein